MPRFHIPLFRSPIDGVAFDIRAPRPAWVVLIAGIAIVILAGISFYRGLTLAPQVNGGAKGATNAILGAKPAVPMAQNPNWSILNGPSIAAPQPKTETQDDDEDDSDSPDEPAAAAEQAPTPAAAAIPATPAPTVTKTLPAPAAPLSASEPPPY